MAFKIGSDFKRANVKVWTETHVLILPNYLQTFQVSES